MLLCFIVFRCVLCSLRLPVIAKVILSYLILSFILSYLTYLILVQSSRRNLGSNVEAGDRPRSVLSHRTRSISACAVTSDCLDDDRKKYLYCLYCIH